MYGRAQGSRGALPQGAELAAEWLKGFQVRDLGSEYYGSIPSPYYRLER